MHKVRVTLMQKPLEPLDPTPSPVKPAQDALSLALQDDSWLWTPKLTAPLQLHCCSVRIQKPHQAEIAVDAEPSQSMSTLLRYFGWEKSYVA